MMNIVVRKGDPEDLGAVIQLIRAFAEFQRSPSNMDNSLERMRDEQGFFNFLVAENREGEIVGYLAYYDCYYTWIGKSIHMDDLYIRPAEQGRGIGKCLIAHLKEIAISNGCHKLTWQVSKWNKKAISFYESLGAEITAEEMNCSIKLQDA